MDGEMDTSLLDEAPTYSIELAVEEYMDAIRRIAARCEECRARSLDFLRA